MSAEAGKPADDGGKTPKNRVAAFKDNVSPRIMLSNQPATGLYVLFSPVPGTTPAPADSSGNAKTAKSDAAGPPSYNLCFIDGQGYPETVTEGTNPWAEIADQIEALAKARASALKKKTTKPLFAPKACKNPHVFKLTEGATYRLCLVSHPNPEVALAAQAYLNGGKPDARFTFPKREELTFEAKVQTDSDEGGKVAHIDLPTDPKRFWPAGHERYGGWVLYQDMPYWHLDGVQTAVSKLAGDLAELRYPTGESGNAPYPSSTSKEHSGRFGTTLMATVHAFQKDAAVGNALVRLKTTASATANAKIVDSWAYLLASGGNQAADPTPTLPTAPEATAAVTPAFTNAPADLSAVAGVASSAASEEDDDKPDPRQKVEANVPKLSAEESRGVGVVTKAVGEAIATWRKSNYRKNGPILVQTTIDSACWARPELATSLALWDLMAKALGCAYGIRLTCTFRELTVPAGVGRVECSNHKLGLSVDLLSVAHRDTSPSWPIHYEANWVESESGVVKSENEKVRKAQAKVKETEQKRDKAKAYLDGLSAKEAAGKSLPTGARAAGEGALKQAEADVESAKAALEQVKDAAGTLGKAVDKSKSNYMLLWRIYGHSSLMVWATNKADKGTPTPVSPTELQALLSASESLGVTRSGPWGIETSLGDLLRKCFPTPADATAKAALDAIVSAGQQQARKVAETLYALAGKEGNAGLIASFFRHEVRPFAYNPFEPDGGTSRPAVTPTTDDKATQAAKAFGKTEIRSYLNITRLGFECGMTRIPAQRAVSTGTFKRSDMDPEYKPKVTPPNLIFTLTAQEKDRKPSDLGKMLKALARAIDDLGKIPDAEKPRVLLGDGKEIAVELADFDHSFIKVWGDILDKPKSPFNFQDLALVLGLSADEAAFNVKVKQLGEVLKKPFTLKAAGKLLNLDDAVGRPKTMQEWSDQLGSLLDSLAPSGKTSTKRVTADSSVVLMPVFGIGSLAGKPLSSIVFPPYGQPAPLEWWHHDNKAMAGSWAAMAEAIGYSGLVVRADDVPPPTVKDGQTHGGLGFSPQKVDRVRKPSTTPPENWSTIPDGG